MRLVTPKNSGVLSVFYKFLVVVFIFLAALQSNAQQVNDSNTVGLPPTGSFHGGGIDVVMIQNGNLHISIPILSVPERGGKPLNWNYIFDTPTWQAVWNPNPTPLDPNNGNYRILPAALEDAGWRLTNPFRYTQYSDPLGTNCPGGTGNAFYRGNYRIVDPDGTIHPFALRAGGWNGPPVPFCEPQFLAGPATDGSGMYWDLQSGKITLKDGSQLAEDTNGNLLAGDTLGRTTLVVTDASRITYTTPLGGTATGPAYTTWVVKDSSGASQTYRLDYAAYDLNTNMCQLIPHGTYPCGEYTVADIRPTKLTLPNGKFYQFTWMNNSAFELLRVDLPTGGSVAYTYGILKQTVPIPPSSPKPPHHTWSTWNIRKTVATRTLTAGSQVSQWQYATAQGGGGVTNPDGSTEGHTFSKIPVGGNIQSAQTVEISVVYKDSTGKVLRTVNKDWAGELGAEPITTYDNLREIRETTILDDGTTTKVETDYETFPYTILAGQYLPGCNCTATRMNPSERREYAYGNGAPGSLVRKTDYAYLHNTGPNAATYTSLNIVDRPTSVIVYDGSGTTASQTTYEYDVYNHTGLPAMQSSGAIQHDPAFTTSYLTRGNLTGTSRWLNTNSTWLATNTQYDDAGNVIATKDPMGNVTNFDYTDSWANSACAPSGVGKAYVTTVTNALGQITKSTYNSCTGTVASRKDQNDINASRAGTTFSYDFFGRLTQKNSPDGGQTAVSYNDVPPVSNTTTTSINTTQSAVTTKISDGLGRIIQTQLTSDPQGIVYIDTTYDLMGRVSTVSNPYRTGTDITTTAGITTFGYDALSRKTSETYPDNSVLTTAYCGPSTLVTDPANRWRRSRTDSLGRLVEVDEPNSLTATVASTGCPGTGEPIWVTSYTLNTPSNLTNVLQNGSHARTFTYDSLSRLLTSANPEVGTITYTYNNDGPVHTKQDARLITTTYGYDALDRQTSAAYSNGDPTTTVVYDGTNCLGLSSCDNIGHRTSMTDAGGSEIWSYQTDATNHRSLHKDQRTTSGITKTTTYILDLAGNTTQATYPTGRVVNYTFDSANRPSTAQDNSSGITYATGFKTSPGGTCLANVTCYTPQGSLYALSIGQSPSFTNGLNLTDTYNNRLEPLEFKATSSGGNAIDITYNFQDPLNNNKNAGHVFSITNNLDSTRSQTFTYDQLNRITTAQTTSTHATSPTHCWGETYQFDGVANGAWGNLTQIAATTNSAYTGCSQESGFSKTADANNHVSGFSYDASGNTSGDGTYTYAWDGESQLKSAGGVNYLYDGDGRRVSKSNGKLYWYGSGGEILAETNASGAVTNEYVFFSGKRVALLPAGASAQFYAEDFLGTSRVVTTNTGVVCYDADFYPYGGERTVTNTCSQNTYKFEGKERDAETGNDDFGARYYSNRFGRWLSADWSAVPVAVPYANLTNPQTLNLYSIVADDPESFPDLDGHQCPACDQILASPEGNEIIEHAIGIVVAGATAAYAHSTGAIDKVVDALKTASDNGMGGRPGPYVGPSFKVYEQAQKDQAPPGAAESNQSHSTPAQPSNQPEPPEQRDRYVNPGHHDTSSPNYVKGKTPLPKDAQSTFGGAIKDTNRDSSTATTYYGKSADGKYYRYQGKNGEVHWNGTVNANKVPKAIRKQLNSQQ